jgi:glycosyltransferase involved in cell wall biosynthesis
VISKKISTLSTSDFSLLSKVGFHGPLLGVGINDGYGYAAIRLIEAIQRLGIPVWYGDTEAPVILNMGQPEFYTHVPGKLNIGYTAWESTEIPRGWLQHMNKMDQIWTMCEEMRARFQEVLDVPVYVLHHGIDRTDWPTEKRKLNGPFKFLHVGGHAPRKGAKIVYECFKDLFPENNNDVLMVFKGYSFQEFKPEGKNVVVLRDTLTHLEMIHLYYSCHAMIYPCKGEGFGLVPFQAASSGMPTAVTDWSGPADYIERCFPIGVARMSDCNYEPHLGQWAEPVLYDIEKWMNNFYDFPNIMFDLAFDKSTRNEQYWTWDNQAKLAVEKMISSLN